ncbi:MAG: hypothetical protein AB8E15_10685 [Bdellovibrionales bacterium]
MENSMDREINKLLKKLTKIDLVVDELLKKWHRGKLSHAEINSLAQFLLHSGKHSSLFSECLYQHSKKSYIPMQSLFLAIDQYDLMAGMSDAQKKSLFLQSEAFQSTDYLIRIQNIENYDEKLGRLKLAFNQDVERAELEKYRKSIQVLHEKIENSGSTIDYKEQIFNLAESLPENTMVKEWVSRFHLENAKLTLKNFENGLNSPLSFEKSELSSIEKLEIENFILHCKNQAIDDYDLAIALMQMGALEEAIEISEFHLHEEKYFWIHIQNLLDLRRYVDCLSFCEKVMKNFTNQPEKVFALTYYQAQALWGAGQHSDAILGLEKLLELRPHYRSAHSLLLQWKRSEL